jgi:nucleoside triphosphate diphosphatase
VTRAAEQLEALLTLMRTLRDPEGGCPWDREQTFETIAPYTIEEAYEVADAIARADLHRLCDELGDLLFQVVFHARMAEERGQFDFADVAQGIREKLVRRHPHVFESPQAAANEDMAALHVSWESQKARERAARGAGGVLADVPAALPALTRAAKLGKRAGRVGFDWDAAAGVRAKIDEELAELDRATAAGRKDEIAEELGDLLFTIANWARHLDLDAEQALRAASLKFERRFESMESQAQHARLKLETLSAAQWEQLWAAAKSLNDKR